jgi:hypothetical protein
VKSGAVITLHCKRGELRGDKYPTCVKNTEFKYKEKPHCEDKEKPCEGSDCNDYDDISSAKTASVSVVMLAVAAYLYI